MLLRYDPFPEFDRISKNFFGPGRQNFMPADAYRNEDRLFLHIDLPGVDPDSIDVTIEKNALKVAAERKWHIGAEDQSLLNERPTGTFSRQFFLGDGLDTDSIEAGYDHGVLTVTLPVAETAKARKIDVRSTQEALPA